VTCRTRRAAVGSGRAPGWLGAGAGASPSAARIGPSCKPAALGLSELLGFRFDLTRHVRRCGVVET